MTITAEQALLLGQPKFLQLAIKRAIAACPEFSKLAMQQVNATSLKIQGVKDATGVFRSANEGVDNNTGTPVDLEFITAIFDASFWIDPAIGARNPMGGTAGMMERTGANKLFNGLIAIAQQVWDGNGVAPNMSGFSKYVPAGNVVAGTGVAGETVADAWLVYSEDTDGVGIQFAGVEGGVTGETPCLKTGEPFTAPATGTNSKPIANAMWTPVTGYPGVYAFNTSLMVKIEGVKKSACNDDLTSAAIALFPNGYKPTMMFCGKTYASWLQLSRTATNPTGSAAPWPVESIGIPIYETAGLPEYVVWTPSIPAGNVAAAGGTKAVTCTGGTHAEAVLAYAVEAGKTWLTLDKATCAATGTVTATAAVNASVLRTAKIYVTEGSQIVTEITVTQTAAS